MSLQVSPAGAVLMYVLRLGCLCPSTMKRNMTVAQAPGMISSGRAALLISKNEACRAVL